LETNEIALVFYRRVGKLPHFATYSQQLIINVSTDVQES